MYRVPHGPLERSESYRLQALALALAIAAVVSSVFADEIQPSNEATVGSEVPSFYVRAVTGPLAGKSVCYVCRNGDRPVVVVLLRDLGPDATALLKELDQTVNRHRADGLRCFAVLLTDAPQKDLARLQTLAFEQKLDIPLTLASEAATTGSPLEFPQESAISVVTYESRRVVQKFSFKSGACDQAGRKSVTDAARKLAMNEK